MVQLRSGASRTITRYRKKINFNPLFLIPISKFPLQLYQKYYITQYEEHSSS